MFVVRSELMPRQRWNIYEIERLDVSNRISYQDTAAPPEYEYGVRMDVPLKCRVSSRCDFEVPQLTRLVTISGEEGLTGDAPKMTAILLVRFQRDILPVESVTGRGEFPHMIRHLTDANFSAFLPELGRHPIVKLNPFCCLKGEAHVQVTATSTMLHVWSRFREVPPSVLHSMLRCEALRPPIVRSR